ncbi:MAG: hypothetical protein ACK47M_09875 [Caldilinea sp.]
MITASVQVISPTFPPGTVLTNTAVAFTNTPDPNPGNNQDSEGVTVGPMVNLSALKTSRAQTATVGTIISYTFVVTNHGPSLAPSIVVTDHLPYRFLYLSSTARNGCVMHNEVTLVCDLGSLSANRSISVDVYFFISSLGHGMVRNGIVAGAPDSALGMGEAESEFELPANPTPTALLLESYTLDHTDDAFIITWKTVSEFRTWGFKLWRSETPNREQAILLTPDGIPATGVGSTYTYVDNTVRERVTYWYWLQELTTDGGGWEYHVLSGRIGGEALYLPIVCREVAVVESTPTEPPTETPTEEPDAAQNSAISLYSTNDGFTVYLSIIGVSSTDSATSSMPTAERSETPPALPAASAVATPFSTPTPAPFEALTPLDTPTLAPSDAPILINTPTPLDTPTPAPLEALTLSNTPTPAPSDAPILINTPMPAPSLFSTPAPLMGTPLPPDG